MTVCEHCHQAIEAGRLVSAEGKSVAHLGCWWVVFEAGYRPRGQEEPAKAFRGRLRKAAKGEAEAVALARLMGR
jgi:hypothetical protein